ncbi:helix-turn-helix domain-containing protein, partial [Thermobifida halotolerans]|uniref:HTH domain-containing protein n=1 Tax=Thermobifida halotolerans TaxID=483545 RepID=UPI0018FEA065
EAQQAELAALRRQAAYARARAEAEAEVRLAEAEVEVRLAEAEAEAQRRREEISHTLQREAMLRSTDLRMAEDQADMEILVRRARLERQLRLARPVLGLTTGSPAPAADADVDQEQAEPGKRRPDLDDPTAVDAAWADIARRLDDDGEGGVAVGGGTPDTPPATPAELGEDPLEARGGGGTPGSGPATGADLDRDRSQDGVGGGTRQRVWQATRRYGPAVSTRAVAEELGVSRTTVRTHREALARQGYPVYDADR